jgi:hypothetical protein
MSIAPAFIASPSDLVLLGNAGGEPASARVDDQEHGSVHASSGVGSRVTSSENRARAGIDFLIDRPVEGAHDGCEPFQFHPWIPPSHFGIALTVS